MTFEFKEIVNSLREICDDEQCRCSVRIAADALEAITENGWIAVNDRLPESGDFVLAFVRRQNREPRIILAAYAAKFSEQVLADDELDCSEYCEADDTYYMVEGWYEINEYEDTHWKVVDPVTHWQSLPPPPES